MSILERSIGDTVELQFPVFDIDGITLVSGLTDGQFTKVLLRDATDQSGSVTTTISEIGTTGHYVATFSPDANGLWFVEVTTPQDDFFGCYVQVGPPSQAIIDGLADFFVHQGWVDDPAGAGTMKVEIALHKNGQFIALSNPDTVEVTGYEDGTQVFNLTSIAPDANGLFRTSVPGVTFRPTEGKNIVSVAEITSGTNTYKSAIIIPVPKFS
jgi:hypothetical protein